ncbi:MAG: glycosyltransferase, partial [Pseudomonadota bacterium]
MSLSIIIPTLNEEAALPATLASVAALTPAPLEVIVADSGSDDRTVELAQSFGARVLMDLPRGRAGQMNAGARQATGDQLCFLHADTEIPSDFVVLVDASVRRPYLSRDLP